MSEQYARGESDYLNGVTECPYPKGEESIRRSEWFNGWLDMRTRDRLGHVFIKNDLSWPPTKAEMDDWLHKQGSQEQSKKLEIVKR